MPNCGRVPSHVCVHFNAGFIASGWAWHCGPIFTCGAHDRDVMIDGCVPRPLGVAGGQR